MSQTDREPYRFQKVTDLVYCPKCNPKGTDKYASVGLNQIRHWDRNVIETNYECINSDCAHQWQKTSPLKPNKGRSTGGSAGRVEGPGPRVELAPVLRAALQSVVKASVFTGSAGKGKEAGP
ncbi:hypothetical protein VTK56DRAFT_6216 [Thermocarpiscus australiensis]